MNFMNVSVFSKSDGKKAFNGRPSSFKRIHGEFSLGELWLIDSDILTVGIPSFEVPLSLFTKMEAS